MVKNVMLHALKCLRGRSRHGEDVDDFLRTNVPKSDQFVEEQPEMRRKSKKRSRSGAVQREVATSSNEVAWEESHPGQEQVEDDLGDQQDELGSLADIECVDVDAESETEAPVILLEEIETFIED